MFAEATDGTRIHYIVEGNGPPIVLVGGRTSNIAGAWWRYIPVLAEHLTVIAFDNRGAGQSDKPDVPYTTRLMADDALAVLGAAGQQSAHWFGLSLGGMIVEQLALAHPDAARSLILGGTSCRSGRTDAPIGEVPELAGNPLRRFASLYDPRFIVEHGEWVAEDARHFGKMPLHAIIRQDQASKHHDVCDRLHEIQQPVLILHGAQDRVVPLSCGEELQRLLPTAQLEVIDRAGHQFHSEQFERVVARVLAFVDEVEATRPTS